MTTQPTGGAIQMDPIKTPTALDATSWTITPSHLALTPAQRISLYDDTLWEEFVLEWATSLSYQQVLRNGGANDHGVDIAAFLSEAGFAGEWHCYQCKHYNRTLLPSDAHPEILKIILGTLDGHFTWPRRYRFAAPKACGTTLGNLLHSAPLLKAAFTAELGKTRSPLIKSLGQHTAAEVLAFVDDADFSVFGTVELHELVEQHGRTRWHSARFGVELPPRPPVPAPSQDPAEDEQRYISQLLASYGERHQQPFDHQEATNHPQTGRHYLRQREAFYSAEALRVFARDSVPEGTYAALQREIHHGVVDVHDQLHADGLERLYHVTQTAHTLALPANGLLPRVEMRDRTGICHQLANDDELRWCHAGPQ